MGNGNELCIHHNMGNGKPSSEEATYLESTAETVGKTRRLAQCEV